MTEPMLIQMAMTLLRDGTVIKTMVLLTMATFTLMLGWARAEETILVDDTPPQTSWAEGPQIGL